MSARPPRRLQYMAEAGAYRTHRNPSPPHHTLSRRSLRPSAGAIAHRGRSKAVYVDAVTTIEVQDGYSEILGIAEHRDPTLCQASTDFERVHTQAYEAQEIMRGLIASEWELDDSEGCPLHPEVISPPPRLTTPSHFAHPS